MEQETNNLKRKEYHREYYKRNKDKYKEYYKKNKKRITNCHKKYYLKNKEKCDKYKRRYYIENKHLLRENKKKYYYKNKKIINEKYKIYLQKNPEKKRIRSIKRETRRLYPLILKVCEYCNEKATEHHHNTNPIEVDNFNYICHNCHVKIHELTSERGYMKVKW